MSITTSSFRFALAAATLCAAAATADAKPRRVVVLDFDGPRGVAETSRTKIVSVLGEQYDVVATKRWEEARATHGRNQHGPGTWQKAAKASGVDAVIEGWIDDEGSYKLLTVQVREARSGTEIDNFSVKLGKSGMTEDTANKLRTQLDDLLDWVEPGVETPRLPTYDAQGVKSLRASKRGTAVDLVTDDEIEYDGRGRAKKPVSRIGGSRVGTTAVIEFEDDDELDGPDVAPDDARGSRKAAPATVATLPGDRQDNDDIRSIFGAGSVEAETVTGVKAKHVPVPTKRVFLEGGLFYSSRTLMYDGEDPQNLPGVSSKGITVRAAAYPFPKKAKDGVASGLGFSGKVWKAPNARIDVDVDDSVATHSFDYTGWQAAVHYRQPLGNLFAIDGEVGYGHESFTLESDIELDVPDTKYGSFHVGGHLDLNIARGATVGFGAAYHYVTNAGDLISQDWNGPGSTSGLNLDANFVIPLPKQLYVRGEVAFRRYATEFSGPDNFDGNLSADDSTVNGSAHVGIAF